MIALIELVNGKKIAAEIDGENEAAIYAVFGQHAIRVQPITSKNTNVYKKVGGATYYNPRVIQSITPIDFHPEFLNA